MKISNRILIGFFLIIFLVPLLVLMSFRSKIRKGEFTVSSDLDGWWPAHRSGSFASFRVVKLVAPDGKNLNCNIYYADSMSYRYGNNGHNDSLRVYNQNDTLFMQYVAGSAGRNNNRHFGEAAIDADVYLPAITHLVLDHSNASIKTVDSSTAGNLLVEMHRNATFRVGINEDYGSTARPVYKYGTMAVNANDGSVRLGSTSQIGQLTVEARGKSSITIDEGASIATLNGRLSDSSSVKASWKYVKKLLPLN